MAEIISLEDFLKNSKGGVIVDVRSPAEFAAGHIEGAYNIPLFDNEQRAVVGTIYKQIGKTEAIEKGLEFVALKMVDMVREARKIAGGRKIFLYCWRGGMRSNSVAWLFSTAQIRCCVLEGGYKAYRAGFDELTSRFKDKLVVLGGPTGGGKSEILNCLKSLGEQVIDLEGLANHKGSVFGNLGEQPTTETFINRLHSELSKLNPERRVWCEGESKAIGSVFIPESFFGLMHTSLYIFMDVPSDVRIGRIMKEYGEMDIEYLTECFRKITKRMGGQNVKAALEAIENGDIRQAAKIALDYYDKGYKNSVYSQRDLSTIHEISFCEDKPLDSALKLCDMIHEIERVTQTVD